MDSPADTSQETAPKAETPKRTKKSSKLPSDASSPSSDATTTSDPSSTPIDSPKKSKPKSAKASTTSKSASPRNSPTIGHTALPAPLDSPKLPPPLNIDDKAAPSAASTEDSPASPSISAAALPPPSPHSQNATSTTPSSSAIPPPLNNATPEPSKPATSVAISGANDSPKADSIGATTASTGSFVMQRRRNNPLQKPVGWNFGPAESLDPKVHSKHAKRQNIALEIMSTENSYIASLQHMYDAFVQPCSSLLTASEVATMFGNLSDILALHLDFCRDISERVNHWNYSTLISDLFLQYIPRMDIYSGFINTYDKGVTLITELQRNPKFQELYNIFAALPASHGLDLNAFRINPVQRLPRLCLLLEDLLRNTIENHPDYSGVKEALSKLKQVSLAVNAAKGASLMREHFESISKRLSGWSSAASTNKVCKRPLLNDSRHLVIEETPMLLLGPTQRLIVSMALFNDGILVARRSDENSNNSTLGPTHKSYQGKLELLDFFALRATHLCKIGTKQVTKISKDWKVTSTDDVDSYHWLEIQVDEKETFLFGVSELKFWHDWPIKFRETLSDLRSKYWSYLGPSTDTNAHQQATQNLDHKTHPPPCAYGTLTYVSSQNAFVRYGGISNKLLNAFHIYNTKHRSWSEIVCTGGPPPALAKHSACLVGSKIWYYGGLVKNTVTVSNDVYTYDVKANAWSGPLQTTGDVPTRGRAGHTMTQVGTKLYLYGGATFDEKKQEVILDEFLEFDTATLKWTLLNKSRVARHGHVAAVLGDAGKFYAWGGRSPGGEFSSALSVYDFAVRDWTEALNITGFVPSPRQWAAGASVQDRHLLVVGGKRDVLQNDVYLLDVNGDSWCKYSLPCVLDPRMSAAIQVVEDPRTKLLSIYLFGGLQLNAETMDTTVYSNQFLTFQLHNKYIQQKAKAPVWTNLKSFAVDEYMASHATASSTARFNFVSKVAQPAGMHVAKAESASVLCNLTAQLSSASRFGETWMAIHARTHLQIAVKVMKKPVKRDTSTEWKQMLKTIEGAQKCKSPALTSYLGVLDQPDTESFWLLSEYCKHGSVRDYLAAGNKLREPQIQFLATTLVTSLLALHSSGLIHGNLKSSNVLLNDSLEFKVCDYALSTSLDALLKTSHPPSPFDAPEIRKGKAPTVKSDIYALGITLVEMADFSSVQPSKSPASPQPSSTPTLTKGKWSSAMEDFISKCTQQTAAARADLETLAAHPWIKTAKTSEKFQLDLADALKKGYAKEAKKRTATTTTLALQSAPAQAPSSPAQQSPKTTSASPSSGKLQLAKNPKQDTSDEGDAEEENIDTLKSRNAVLRKKLRLLKKAYAELGLENTKLKEQLEALTGSDGSSTPRVPAGSSPRSSVNLSTGEPGSPSDSIIERSGSSGSIKSSGKRSSTKLSASPVASPQPVSSPVSSKERGSRKSLKVTDASTVLPQGE